MGFLKPNSGKITILGMDSYIDSPIIKNYIGYVPGEISMPNLKSGREVLKSQMELLGKDDSQNADKLIKTLQLNINAYPKRMSKGMKQKMALVIAMMNDPDILILDEPTTGLDPLMQQDFINLLIEEKNKGKTILMSSNIYSEMETLADHVALISKGKILAIADNNAIKNAQFKDYKVEFNDLDDYQKALSEDSFKIIRTQDKFNQITYRVDHTSLNNFFRFLKDLDVKFISEIPYGLENYFKETLKENNK